eukprot:3909964-Pyramimonas_sp.AAC.1
MSGIRDKQKKERERVMYGKGAWGVAIPNYGEALDSCAMHSGTGALQGLSARSNPLSSPSPSPWTWTGVVAG